MHSLTHILTPLPTSSPFFWSNYSSNFLQLSSPSPRHYLFSLWFFVLFWIHETNSKRSFLLYVVDVIERASTPDYSSNWDWNQLFLNFSDLLLKSAYQLLKYII